MEEVGWSWASLLWDVYLCSRQRSVYRGTTRRSLPQEVQELMDEDTLARARAYSMARLDMMLLKALYDAVLHTLLVLLGGHRVFWDASESLVDWTGLARTDVSLSCVFIFIMNSVNTAVWLPVELYAHFVIEDRHGFNRLTLGFFTKDKLKGFLLSQLASLLFTLLAMRILLGEGDYVFLRLWLFLVLVFFLINAVYPDLVAPLFDSFHPLPDSRLRNAVETLTHSVGFPINRVFVMEASKRTYHSDAYHVGIWQSKRIVLFDTLLEGRGRGLEEGEVVAVLGHELGHWKNSHILKLTAVTLLLSLVVLLVYGPSMLDKFLLGRSGLLGDYPHPHPVFRVYFLLVHFLPPRVSFMSVGLLWVSRSLESEADGFVGSLGLAPQLRRALVKVHRDNLLFPVHDWLYAASFLQHPSLLDRIHALHRYE